MIVLVALVVLAVPSQAFTPSSAVGYSEYRILQHLATSSSHYHQDSSTLFSSSQSKSANYNIKDDLGRRAFISAAAAGIAISSSPLASQAVGPVKIDLEIKNYRAVICPPDRPIPGEKAMLGMRGLCVTCEVALVERAPKNLEKVGVYGFVTDGETGDSVLANNPDLSTDAGQFAMVESVTTDDDIVTFEFIAAVPREKDLSKYTNGIGPLHFQSLRLINYPGGQQFGAISPCEMNEFSDECEAWEAENGPYKKAEYTMKSNPRTKGR